MTTRKQGRIRREYLMIVCNFHFKRDDVLCPSTVRWLKKQRNKLPLAPFITRNEHRSSLLLTRVCMYIYFSSVALAELNLFCYVFEVDRSSVLSLNCVGYIIYRERAFYVGIWVCEWTVNPAPIHCDIKIECSFYVWTGGNYNSLQIHII